MASSPTSYQCRLSRLSQWPVLRLLHASLRRLCRSRPVLSPRTCRFRILSASVGRFPMRCAPPRRIPSAPWASCSAWFSAAILPCAAPSSRRPAVSRAVKSLAKPLGSNLCSVACRPVRASRCWTSPCRHCASCLRSRKPCSVSPSPRSVMMPKMASSCCSSRRRCAGIFRRRRTRFPVPVIWRRPAVSSFRPSSVLRANHPKPKPVPISLVRVCSVCRD